MIDISKGKYWQRAWQLIDGCTPCSPGCENCWSAAMAHRFEKKDEFIPVTDDNGHFNAPAITDGAGQPARTSSEGGLYPRWPVEPDVGRMAHGVANRVDRLKALGNGQVPRVVAAAWKILMHSITRIK